MTSQRRLVRSAGILAAVVLFFVACSVGNVDFANKACPCGAGYVCDVARNVCVTGLAVDASASGDSGPVTNGCTGPSCACNVDGDCTDPIRKRCGASKLCVECVGSADNCGPGTYCNESNQCVAGCKGSSDCQISPASPICNVTRHQCVQCLTLADCTDADQCSPAGECVEGCDLDAGKLCSGTKTCCNKLCIDTTKDPFNCGSCGVECSKQNSTPTCVDRACTWKCAAGYAHCGTENTGCEVNLQTDLLNCGACGHDCNTAVKNATGIGCAAAACTYQACNTNFDNCDNQAGNGCECSCGTKRNERCCPGKVCNPGLTCNAGANKCQ